MQPSHGVAAFGVAEVDNAARLVCVNSWFVSVAVGPEAPAGSQPEALALPPQADDQAHDLVRYLE